MYVVVSLYLFIQKEKKNLYSPELKWIMFHRFANLRQNIGAVKRASQVRGEMCILYFGVKGQFKMGINRSLY